MRILCLVISCLLGGNAFADITVISWNAKHLGRKTQNLDAAAKLLAGADILAIQEVNSSESGAKALTKLAATLSVEGIRYCMGLSEIPTDSKERYGFLWNEASISYVTTQGSIIGTCPPQAITLRLGAAGAAKIIREPAVGVFLERSTGKKFTMATIHLVPTAKRPENEVAPLFETVEGLPGKYPKIVLGDFNLGADHPAFDVARTKGYSPLLAGDVKTSLRSKTTEMSKAYDNIWIFGASSAGAEVINPHMRLSPMDGRLIYRTVSDHAPIKAMINLGGK